VTDKAKQVNFTSDNLIANPLISVIVPTYNRAKDLERCLASLLEQSFSNFEVLVCDDGSTDNTEFVIRKYVSDLSIIYLWSENWGGPARPRNLGLEKARGKYVAFLDSDDWWSKDKLKASVSALEDGADIVYHKMYLVHKEGSPETYKKNTNTRALQEPVFLDLAINGNCINNSSVVVKKELMKQIGGFSESRSLIAAEDYHAWLELARLKKKFRLVNKVLGYYWIGGGNISSSIQSLSNLTKLRQKYLDNVENPENNDVPAYFQYSTGKAHMEQCNYKQAKACFRIVISNGIFFNVRVKALILYSFCTFRIMTHS